ncbi:hypothetical protein FOL47_004043 [Perkinsus chesapeaki]|uniref:Peptidase A1 domain-containing protein n=1 Tax=Perkinsus chesapeaki TaxID=330153 RepID=A0A7J6M4W1_PERCH|nr:hypothetical protein FOL47_004043 [Perkinsus chesapeaki]
MAIPYILAYLFAVYPLKSYGNLDRFSLELDYDSAVIVLDGQTVKLTLDSGSPGWYVMSGDAYEKKHGKGSCKGLADGCYFCTKSAPCDDILDKKPKTTSYYDEDCFHYVDHVAALSLGDLTIPGMKFGLIVEACSPVRGEAPKGVLGLSLGEEDTFINQLRTFRVINETSYTVDMAPLTSQKKGSVFLGHSKEDVAELNRINLTRRPDLEYLTTHRSSLYLFGHDGNSLIHGHTRDIHLHEEDPMNVLIDTGTTSIDLTINEYYRFCDVLKAKSPTSTEEAAFIDERGAVWVQLWAFRHLPTLGFDFVDGPNGFPFPVRIRPGDYLRTCYSTQCMLDILVVQEDRPLYCMGHPFFRAYYTYINLETMMMYLSMEPRKPAPSTRQRRKRPQDMALIWKVRIW